MQNRVVGVGLGVCLMSVAGTAAAQPTEVVTPREATTESVTSSEQAASAEQKAGSIAGRWAMGIEAGLAQLYWRKSDEQSAFVGVLGGSGAGPDAVIGYGLNEHWLLTATGAVRRTAESSLSPREWMILARPELSYVFGAGFARPMVGGQATVQTVWSSRDERLTLGGGVHAGVRLGLVERLSLEPRVGLDYHYLHGRYDYQQGTVEQDAHHVAAIAGIRFCGWL
jgi:hypothetical protein